eukprot:TRINITY_DN10617_c0_g1_i1.p2 TRINITY_DN10617_c0_g1~~TRINITY_DN10617_c0_g1_i1.p2  ORF type:complete len:138 (-),score=49.10 TRINITY_DN10617_c0_g1_i1:427-840(-)
MSMKKMDVTQKLGDLQAHVNALREGVGTALEDAANPNFRNQQQTIIGSESIPKETLARFYSLGQHMKSIEKSLEGFSDHYVIVPHSNVPPAVISDLCNILDCSQAEDKTAKTEREALKDRYEDLDLLSEDTWIVRLQ